MCGGGGGIVVHPVLLSCYAPGRASCTVGKLRQPVFIWLGACCQCMQPCAQSCDLPLPLALQAVFEKPEHQEQIAGLLRTLGDVGAVSLTQMGKGFGRVRAALEDFQLDYPHCADQLAVLEQLGRQQGWLPAGEAV